MMFSSVLFCDYISVCTVPLILPSVYMPGIRHQCNLMFPVGNCWYNRLCDLCFELVNLGNLAQLEHDLCSPTLEVILTDQVRLVFGGSLLVSQCQFVTVVDEYFCVCALVREQLSFRNLFA